MDSVVALVIVAIGLFVSTNLDDMFLLVAFLSEPKFKPSQVALGQFVGLATLYALSVVASLLALVIPPAYVRLLGILPILIGAKKLWELRTSSLSADEPEEESVTSKGRGNALAVAAVTIADGGDNLSIYIPTFATKSALEIGVIGLVFAVMTLVWVGVAFWLTRHGTLGKPIRRHGRQVVPFLLIGLGIYIVMT